MGIDTLIAEEKCEAFELAVESVLDPMRNLPRMKPIGATFGSDEEELLTTRSQWTGELSVPFRSRMVQDSPERRVICSPSCLAMVMEYYGKDLPTLDVAAGVFDNGPGKIWEMVI